MTPNRKRTLRPREKYLRELRRNKDSQHIKVLTGIRRSGKSTILRMFMDELKSSGISEKNIVYINFDIRHSVLPECDVELEDYVEKILTPGEGTYLFFDEIQNVERWENAIVSFYTRGSDVYVTGSNSQMLSSDLATKLSGRMLEINVLPLAFSEYLIFRENSGKTKEELFSDYLRDGGMPGIAIMEDDENFEDIPRALDDIYKTVCFSDIVERYEVRNPSVMMNVISFMMENVGHRTSMNNIAGMLRSKRIKISVPTVQDYIGYITDSFLLTKAERIESATMNYLMTTNKFYATDIGIRNFVSPRPAGDMSALLENVVFNELRYRYGNAMTVDVDGKEVDFAVRTNTGFKYYQVCVNINEGDTMERELRPLRKIENNYPKTVITYDRYPFGDIDGYLIVPLLKWLTSPE